MSAKDCMDLSASALRDAELLEVDRAKFGRYHDSCKASRDHCLFEAQRYEQLAVHALQLERKKWADLLRSNYSRPMSHHNQETTCPS